MNKILFEKLAKSIEQGAAIHRGERSPSRSFEVEEINVKELRNKTQLSQTSFAKTIGVSVITLQNWEQGKRYPTGTARTLLKVFQKKPKEVIEALHIN